MESPTLREVLEKYMEVRGPRLRSSTVEQYPKFILRCFGDWMLKSVDEISRFDCESRYFELCQLSNAKATTQGKTQAINAFRILGALFNFSIAYWDAPRRNPVQQFRTIVKPERSSAKDYHIPPDMLGEWYQHILRLNPTERDMQIMWLLTGVRHRALAGAMWSEVDYEKRLLTIPKEREKNKCINRVNLTPFMIRLLRKRQLYVEGSPYIFPSLSDMQRPCIHSGRTYIKIALQLGENPSGAKVASNPHALRHTFATCASLSGLKEDDVAILLNHSKDTVTGGYIHVPFSSVRPLWIQAQSYIQSKLGVTDDKPRIRIQRHELNIDRAS